MSWLFNWKGGIKIELQKLKTEERNTETLLLDTMSPQEIVKVMHKEDFVAMHAIDSELDKIAQVIEWTTETLYNQGRIIYIGAGTSGRLGVLDAVECPPTFGVNPSTVIGLIAGGERAFIKAQEGAEDSEVLAQIDLTSIDLKSNDCVIGLAASGRTPYVIGGLKYARKIGCRTVTIACTDQSEIGKYADICIEAVTGPEVLTGSTRLKAELLKKQF